ncbi:MAG: glycerate kinase [Actinobacteria bacterium]|nr:glycerate kinase [Actinomycetota bacterium]
MIAPGAFKGSLDAKAVAESLAEGVRQVWPQARLVLLPLSDGGDGWVESMVSAADGSFVDVTAQGPLGDAVEARYGIINSGGVTTAVIEMAKASGLALLGKDERDPRRATSYGTGELMRDALDRDAERLLIGIGGSATNDGGAGMASALGARFSDRTGAELAPGGTALAELGDIDLSGLDPRLKDTEIVVASDVDNPLLGESGASAVYGPQKGATPEMVSDLDTALSHFADVLEDAVGRRLREEPGAGAAGGLGFGLMAVCDAVLRPGVELALDAVQADRVLEGASLVITAEVPRRGDSRRLLDRGGAGIRGRAHGSHGDTATPGTRRGTRGEAHRSGRPLVRM